MDNMKALSRPALLSAGLAVLVWQACRTEGCCGPVHSFFSVYVGVRLDSAAFRSNGKFLLELVPTDQTGQAFVSDSWNISTTLEEPASVAVTLDSQRVQPADSRAAAAAIHIDDSGSMLHNDKDSRRATAAQLFWNELLGAGGGNLVALLDFGRGTPDTPSPGFRATRLLQSFTSDASLLDAKLSSIQAAAGGGTRLYRSAWEVARWFDTTVAANSHKRTLVIITDGMPRDTLGYKDSLFAATAAAQIRILAVGVGPASDHGTESVDSAVAVLRELATQTNGVYAGADEAQQLEPILHALANVSTSEQLLAELRIDPVPPSGTFIAGTVTIKGKRGRATAGWSFIAP